VIPAIHVASQLPLDVTLAGPGLEEDMLARARHRPVGDTAMQFVDTPDLIVLKILAGRDKDLEDVRALDRAGLLDRCRPPRINSDQQFPACTTNLDRPYDGDLFWAMNSRPGAITPPAHSPPSSSRAATSS
jgi:hypothetical protein